jgi:hypothetical protein
LANTDGFIWISTLHGPLNSKPLTFVRTLLFMLSWDLVQTKHAKNTSLMNKLYPGLLLCTVSPLCPWVYGSKECHTADAWFIFSIMLPYFC